VKKLLVPLLALLNVISGFAVVASTQDARNLTSRLQVLEARQWFLRDESSRLLLELSAYTQMSRVDSIAAQIEFVSPSPSEIRVVRP
jgi:cell division protein FtsL